MFLLGFSLADNQDLLGARHPSERQRVTITRVMGVTRTDQPIMKISVLKNDQRPLEVTFQSDAANKKRYTLELRSKVKRRIVSEKSSPLLAGSPITMTVPINWPEVAAAGDGITPAKGYLLRIFPSGAPHRGDSVELQIDFIAVSPTPGPPPWAIIRNGILRLEDFAQSYYRSNGNSYVGYDSCVDVLNAATCKGGIEASVADEVRKITSAGGSIQVNASVNRFCISSPLPPPSSEYFCIDAAMQLKQGSSANCGATATVCP